MREVLLIAGYELRRTFRPKDLIWTVVISLVSALVLGLVQGRKSDDALRTLAVLGNPPSALNGFTLEAAEDEALARARLERSEIDGVLDLRLQDAPRLLVRKGTPAWQQKLDGELTRQRAFQRASDLGLDLPRLTQALEPVSTSLEKLTGQRSKARLIAALIVVGSLILSIFGGAAYLFVGITGEKRRRVTETVVAVVRPQTWMDGKLLGLGLASLQTLLHVAVGWGVFKLVAGRSNPTLAALDLGIQPLDVLPFLLIAIPGFAFWFCLVAAFCATISDPDTSARGSILMLPAVALALPLLFLGDPDSPALRLLSLLPPTAPSALSMRWILSDVPTWELALALGLLLLSAWLLRLAAGRIFAMSMLLHGSEPSLSAMWRAARHG
jgi:ABC-2 type transport system permease protein